MSAQLCPTGKVVFTRRKAAAWAAQQRRMGRTTIDHYGCKLCGGWHTGNARARHWRKPRRVQW